MIVLQKPFLSLFSSFSLCLLTSLSIAQNANAQAVQVFSLDAPAPAPTIAPPSVNAAYVPPVYAAPPAQSAVTPAQYTPTNNYSQTTPAAGDISSSPFAWIGTEWSGRVNVGASMDTGNTDKDAINIDAEASNKWEGKHRASAKLELNIEHEDDDTTEDNRELALAYDYFIKPKWFLNSTLGFEQDDLQDLDLRTEIGIGLGHQMFEGDDRNLQYIIGPSYLMEEFENGDSNETAAVRWALDYDQMIWDATFQIFHNHELLVPTDEPDSYLLDTKTGIRLPIRKGIVATAEIEFDWDNAPEPGISEDDTTYALKIGYEW